MSNTHSHAPDSINIDHLAALARLELTPEEKKTFSGQLQHILDHFHSLDAVDVSGVEPTAHAFPLFNVWEDDEPGPCFTPDEALLNAPAKRQNQLIVPTVVE